MPQGPIRNWKFRYPVVPGQLRPDPDIAVNKRYVDWAVSQGSGGGGPPPAGVGQLLEDRYVNAHGDTMDPNATIVLGRDPAADMEAATKQYVDQSAAGFIDGQGLTLDTGTAPPTLNLDEATDIELGGVVVHARAADQGLALDAAGVLSAPPATDLLAGSLLEPPQDGLSYARRFDTAALPPAWIWEPTLTPGLQIESVVPPEVLIDPLETDPFLVNVYGQEFTATTVIYFDALAMPTAFVSATHVTTEIDRNAAPGAARYVTVTVQDPAATPPEGAGAEPFEYVLTQLDIAGEVPAEVGVIYVPPDRGLALANDGQLALKPASDSEIGGMREPPFGPATWVRSGEMRWVPAPLPADQAEIATNTELGLVKVPARNDHSQGLDLDSQGFLFAPPATHEHLGSIVEPPLGNQLYARTHDADDNPVWEAFDYVEDVPENEARTFGRSGRGWVVIDASIGGLAGVRYVEKTGDTMLGTLTLAHEGGLAMEPVTVSQLDAVRDLIPPDGGIDEPPVAPVALWGRTSGGARGWAEVPSFDHLTGFVEKIGDTMRGFLTLHADPEEPHHAATRNWVELELQLKVDEPPNDDKAYARKWKEWVEVEDAQGMEEPPAEPVAIWGRSSSGDRGWLEVPTFDALDGKVDKFGDTMTGKLTLDGNPTQPFHAATKDYVDLNDMPEAPRDGKIYGRKDALWEEVTPSEDGGIDEPPMSPVAIWGRSSGGARGWLEIDRGGGMLDPALYVHVAGDTMQGTLTLAHEGGLAMEAVTVSQLNTLRDEIKPLVPVGRGPTNGLENGYDDVLKAQTIWVPLATEMLAGAIVEPPPDSKQYARTNDTANGPAWVENIAKGVHTDDAPPMTPSDGALWWKSSTGALYVFYEDIDSGQWVQVNGTPSPDATISTGDTPPSNPRPNQLWFESDRGSLFFWYADADSSQWVEILGGSGGTAGSAPPVDLTGYATEVWVQDQIANAVIDAQAFVTAAATKANGHDTDLCQQALKAVEGLAVSVKQLQKGHAALKARVNKLEARHAV